MERSSKWPKKHKLTFEVDSKSLGGSMNLVSLLLVPHMAIGLGGGLGLIGMALILQL